MVEPTVSTTPEALDELKQLAAKWPGTLAGDVIRILVATIVALRAEIERLEAEKGKPADRLTESFVDGAGAARDRSR